MHYLYPCLGTKSDVCAAEGIDFFQIQLLIQELYYERLVKFLIVILLKYLQRYHYKHNLYISSL